MSVKRHVKVSRARKAAANNRVAVALAKFLKQANPAMKTAGAAIQRLKGGVLKITPIKVNAAKKYSTNYKGEKSRPYTVAELRKLGATASDIAAVKRARGRK